MDERFSRPAWADNRIRERPSRRRGVERRPDRVAYWAFLLAVFMMATAAATAQGGTSSSGGTAMPTGDDARFGERLLRVGMEGADVRVLNGIMRSKRYADAVRLGKLFKSPTARAVRRFQAYRDLPVTGAVNRSTARELTRSMRRATASWYGPGFYGNRTACGRILRRGTIGVAHRTLPCGTRVTFAYRGRYLVAPVIDRGPFVRGRMWDLTNGARLRLGIAWTQKLRYAIAR